MAENNLVEMAFIRKRQVIGEIIRNTESCCLVWSKTLQSRQYKASTRVGTLSIASADVPGEQREYEFYISQINATIYLDVLVNCKRFVTYGSDSFPDVVTLYRTIEGIWNSQTNNLGEAVQVLQNVPPQCGILYTEYTRGGVVVGGGSESELNYKKTDGGVVVGGHSPYNQRAIPEGGALIGGEAKVNPIIENPEGGVVVGVGADIEFILETKGGVVAGGEALFETTIETLGGSLVAGSADVSLNQSHVATGGVIVPNPASRALWLSQANLSTFGEMTYSDLDGSSFTVYDSITFDGLKIALDPENDRVFWQGVGDPDVFVASQLDPNSATKIYEGTNFTTNAGIDYDPAGEMLAFAHRSRGEIIPTIFILTSNGTLVNSFQPELDGASGDIVRANCLDYDNDSIFILKGTSGSGSPAVIEKYSLTSLTRISQSPNIILGRAKMEIDRDEQLLFSTTGGTPSSIYSFDYDYNRTTILSGSAGYDIRDIALDTFNKKVYAIGDTNLMRMDYDGGNFEILRNDLSGLFLTFGSNIEIQNFNNFEVAIVEHLQSPRGGSVIGGEAIVAQL